MSTGTFATATVEEMEAAVNRAVASARESRESVPDSPGVYMVRGAGGYVKVGKAARSIRDRVAGIQTNHPVRLELLAVLSKNPADERAFHSLFSAHRVHGEWFRLEGVVLEALRKIGGPL